MDPLRRLALAILAAVLVEHHIRKRFDYLARSTDNPAHGRYCWCFDCQPPFEYLTHQWVMIR